MEFGGDLYSYGYGHARRKWSITRVTDQNNNYYKISYLKPSIIDPVINGSSDGVHYPSRIDYSGNAGNPDGTFRSVVFGYTTKGSGVALSLEYEGGFPIREDRFLSSIQVLNGTTELGGYKLTYEGLPLGYGNEPVHLRSIERCESALNSTCLSPLTFGWMQEGSVPKFSQVPVIDSAFPGTRADYQHYFADVAGNGKKWWFRISKGADEAWVGSAKADGTFSADRWLRISTPVGIATDYEFRFADWNGDGKVDWIRIEKATGNASIALGNGDGTFNFWTRTIASMGSSTTYQHEFGDTNSDGHEDWIRIVRATGVVSVGLSLSDGSVGALVAGAQPGLPAGPVEYRMMDLNADGLIDVAIIGKGQPSRTIFSVADGSGKINPVSGALLVDTTPSQIITDDINGDGIPDVIAAYVGDYPMLKYVFGRGDGWTDRDSFPDVQYGPFGGRFISGDFNGNGKSVLVGLSRAPNPSVSATPVVSYTSTTVAGGSSIQLDGSVVYDYYAVDLNGDGKDDLVQVHPTTGLAKVGLGIGQNNERIVSFTNGMELPTLVTYRDLTDATVYIPDSNASTPVVDQRAPMLPVSIAKMNGLQRKHYLVSSVQTPMGGASSLTTTYQYGGLKIDRDRRTLLGFRWMQSKQVETGIAVKTEFRQDWPYTGNVATVTKSLAGTGNNGMLSQTVNAYGCNDFVTTGGACTVAIGRRYRPYLSQTTTSAWDLNGAALPGGSAGYMYDNFGNATRVTTSTTDGYSKVVDTTYSNDTNKWWIGKPLRVTETVTAP